MSEEMNKEIDIKIFRMPNDKGWGTEICDGSVIIRDIVSDTIDGNWTSFLLALESAKAIAIQMWITKEGVSILEKELKKRKDEAL